MSIADAWVGSRSQFVLRLMDKVHGVANQDVICAAMEAGGFARDPRSAFRADLDHLVKNGCLTEEWSDDVRILTLTERGTDAAHGRVDVPGVAHERG